MPIQQTTNNILIKIKGIKKRRYLFVIPLVLFTLDATLEELHFDLYQGLATMITGMIIVYNFPFIISGMHSRPKYIEDIVAEYELTDDARQYYKRIFEYVIGTISSLLLGGLVYNTLRTNNEIIGWMNLAGIIGGVISIYGKFLRFSGKGFISCLDRIKTSREKTSSQNSTDIAMRNVERIVSASDMEGGKLPPDHLIKSQLSGKRSRSNTAASM